MASDTSASRSAIPLATFFIAQVINEARFFWISMATTAKTFRRRFSSLSHWVILDSQLKRIALIISSELAAGNRAIIRSLWERSRHSNKCLFFFTFFPAIFRGINSAALSLR